jgi:hypothetical protein
MDPGGVYIEPRHTEETFEESLQRCLDNVNPAAPLDRPLRLSGACSDLLARPRRLLRGAGPSGA